MLRMKKSKLGIYRVTILVASFILIMVPFCLAGEKDLIRTQGLINPGGNPKAGYLFINEMRVYIDRTTQIMNHYGTSIPITELKPKKFVYIEMEKDPNQSINKAKKIYLLPHYINPQDKGKFSFMP